MIGTVFDTATISLATDCLTDATNKVRQGLSKRYDFTTATFETTTTFPPLVTSMVNTFAIGMMIENMSRGSKEGLARADRYFKRANADLLLIQNGDAELIDPSGNVIDQVSTDWKVESNTSGYSNTFNEDNPKHWRPDSTKLDDIDSERE